MTGDPKVGDRPLTNEDAGLAAQAFIKSLDALEDYEASPTWPGLVAWVKARLDEWSWASRFRASVMLADIFAPLLTVDDACALVEAVSTEVSHG